MTVTVRQPRPTLDVKWCRFCGEFHAWIKSTRGGIAWSVSHEGRLTAVSRIGRVKR